MRPCIRGLANDKLKLLYSPKSYAIQLEQENAESMNGPVLLGIAPSGDLEAR